MSAIVAPSILSANFLQLQNDIELINKSSAEWIHFDVMDGVFVPNISFGFPLLKAIRKATNKCIDVHLMVANADPYLTEFKNNGADNITVHLEASPHLHRTLSAIKNLGCKAGIAINPHTPVQLLAPIISMADIILVMSVNPGFGGQKFIESTYQKVIELKALIQSQNANTLIEVDGGVDLINAVKLKEFGANVLVAGNTVFASENPTETISKLGA